MIRKFHLVNGLIESLITTCATDNHENTKLSNEIDPESGMYNR